MEVEVATNACVKSEKSNSSVKRSWWIKRWCTPGDSREMEKAGLRECGRWKVEAKEEPRNILRFGHQDKWY